MRRRIFLAILATVVLALALAGSGTYLVLRREANRTSEENVRAEAERLAALMTAARESETAQVNQQRLVASLRVEGFSVLVTGPGGRVRGELPAGLDPDAFDPELLVAGSTISGRTGGDTWAAASAAGVAGSTVTVVVARPTVPPRAPVGWFLLAGGLALVVGLAVAIWLSDTLTRPLRRAREATGRIAAGDLATPLPEPPPGDQDEVADLTRSINAMTAALAHSRGLDRQFVLSVSHDLRTPLTSIRGYADAITDGTAPDAAEAARIIGAESDRLARLVGDLLDLGRLDANEFSLHPRPVALGEVVAEAVEAFVPTAAEAGVDLSLDDASADAVVVVDPDRLVQALGNLVENALKFALTEVRVTARPVPDAAAVEVAVTDDGPGIAPGDVGHVFERLYAADRRPRRQVGGTGLGLAIVRELIGAMGGAVRAESPALDDGRGARLVVALPARIGEAGPSTGPEGPVPGAGA
ncbi:MAG: HAMP domain-containing histidine kinase [Acidimicrobiales bacterium]|nr:HAMP domain-containing histidine kinase [Acidimicrobiales bacterium]